jgi:ribonuclease HII
MQYIVFGIWYKLLTNREKIMRKKLGKKARLVIGIDEVGRGPLAGPVTVGAFWAEEKMRKKLVLLLGGKIKDSKQLTHEQRAIVNGNLFEMRDRGEVDFAVAHTSAIMIDKIGISKAISRGISRVLQKCQGLTLPRKKALFYNKKIWQGQALTVRLDGLLKAPKKYKNQRTIIKGDEKDVFIACASIVAKVSRDNLMCRLARKFPMYAFEVHKGYGTQIHRKYIEKFGLSTVHRLSFNKLRV